ncbi:hypothetical protein Fcan01_14339 [Folsomia candida]|uniref:Uncharacterized protein n=1 Tax=Folsomia candida TaxID=158441 RepID=A0A226E468_FOLCA|nr:hypothetical protein Fcan01_14339 [Folsomia candida]
MTFKVSTNLISYSLHLGEKYRCLPVKWDTVQRKVVPITAKKRMNLIFVLFLHFLMSLGRLASIRVHSSSDTVGQLEATFGALVYITMFLIRFDVPFDQAQLQLVNLLIVASRKQKSCKFSDGFL